MDRGLPKGVGGGYTESFQKRADWGGEDAGWVVRERGEGATAHPGHGFKSGLQAVRTVWRFIHPSLYLHVRQTRLTFEK